jgi:hypothetical protein
MICNAEAIPLSPTLISMQPLVLLSILRLIRDYLPKTRIGPQRTAFPSFPFWSTRDYLPAQRFHAVA